MKALRRPTQSVYGAGGSKVRRRANDSSVAWASMASAGRTTEGLRGARQRVFDAFPQSHAPMAVMQFQELLADEILRTEAELGRERSHLAKAHLHSLRLYGDALAHALLSRYAVRQLARNPGKPPALAGQGTAFSLVMESARSVAAGNVCPLVADLTHTIRNGDVIACDDAFLPRIIECKSSQPKHENFERQGRRGRQLARRSSIERFLREGDGVIFGEDSARHTVVLDSVTAYSWSVIDDLTMRALRRKAVTAFPHPGEVIAAAFVGESVDSGAVVEGMGVAPGDHVMVGSTSDALSWGISDVPPPMCWPIDLEARWALMERDVSIVHCMRLETLIGFTEGEIRIIGLRDVDEQIPWRYEVAVGDEVVTLSATSARDVVYCHRTMLSAGGEVLEVASRATRMWQGGH